MIFIIIHAKKRIQFNLISEKFNTISKSQNYRLAFFSLNKLDTYIKSRKDILSKLSKKHCNTSYVDQTGRKLQTKIQKHHNDIKCTTNN